MAIVQCQGIDHDLVVYVCTRRCEAGEAIERGREGNNKVKFGLDWIGMSARVCGWRGVAWRVMSVRAFLVLVLVLGSWIVGVRGMSGPPRVRRFTPLRPLLPPCHRKRALKRRRNGVHVPQRPPGPHEIVSADDIPAEYPHPESECWVWVLVRWDTDERDESVPFAYAAVEFVVVPCLAVFEVCL
jgi:hypothetical protein